MCAVLQDPAWSAVADKCTRHMRWDAECRLRTACWYACRTTFRGRRTLEPEMQWLRVMLELQIAQDEKSVGDGSVVADADWL